KDDAVAAGKRAIDASDVTVNVASVSGRSLRDTPKSCPQRTSSARSDKFDSLYRLDKEEVGRGNYSVVRVAYNKQTGEKVAVKCIKRSALSQADEVALKSETTILSTLDHPNIVKMLSFHKERQYYYIVLEMLNGGELFDRIVKKQFYTEKEARDVLKVLLEAIRYFHEHNIVHRDLKPENLLLVSKDDDALIKVADFGFARDLQFNNLTVQCGTPGYVAPEILKGLTYGKEVDMWSVGVITFILLGGYPPFHDDNRAVLFKKIKRGKVVFHAQYWDHVSQDAKDLIMRMLTVSVADRITAAQALEHPWVKQDSSALEKRDLAPALEQLKRFNARRKLRSAIASIIMTNRLLACTDSSGAVTGSSPHSLRTDNGDDSTIASHDKKSSSASPAPSDG
ncbi:a2+/calmodulin-dependent protein kinase, partial [Tribonema minus]